MICSSENRLLTSNLENRARYRGVRLIMENQNHSSSETDLSRCTECGQQYSIRAFLSDCAHYFAAPYNYEHGCEKYCLQCWLGIGPLDIEKLC